MIRKSFLGALALAATQTTFAAVVTVNGAFTATDWHVTVGSPAAPIDTLFLQYSVTFDDALTYDSDASVLTVLSTNIPYTFDFSYAAGNPEFALATDGHPGGCQHTPSSFCAFVFTAGTGVPFYVAQRPPGPFGVWEARTISAGVPVAVPEPAAWALVAAAGIVGGVTRRRRAASAAY